ncbi:hypothetical protein ABT337_25755 [Saccharopolyspora hirsuta]|uniref:Uncharacterized protein n=1 Tax=Saccharopolyspora hirsuta TaxID=1837 RepID=A0A5M7BPY8_SACHI|nr:hypothetical protein [Saccharopolyspora hirsuta]KAA5829221.1 hypothetical protein F1721_26515 [Saccharopolyspora hirsuta]MBF6508104.1 hypothetical protein [Nocardia farcinica]
MHTPTQFPQGVPVTRQVVLFGDRPDHPERSAFTANAKWWVVGEEVFFEIATPSGTFRASSTNLFNAMMNVRLNHLEPNKLMLMTAGCRYDVWSTLTPEGYFPGPRGTVHGTGESVDLLATVDQPNVDRVRLVRDQLKFHTQHADN